MTILSASPKNMNVLVVIDTEYIKENYPKRNKQDKENPTSIDHNSHFMIVTGTIGIVSGQGTADLNFQANSNDNVLFTGTSSYDNSYDAVIVYGIKYWSGTEVFLDNELKLTKVTIDNAVMPDDTPKDALPPKSSEKLNFNTYSTQVKRFGRENFYVDIALYALADDGKTQSVYDYFRLPASITVFE